jgi:uncharacterized protein DUF3108
MGCVLFVIINLMLNAGPVISQNSITYGSSRHKLANTKHRERPNMRAFSTGEELVYEVTYMGIALGTVTSRVTRIDTLPNNMKVYATGLIKTYDGVPFVTLNTVFRSIFDKNCSSIYFATRERLEDTRYKYIHYKYKPKRDSLYIKVRVADKDLVHRYDTLYLNGLRWQDGLSLLFYARAHVQEAFKDTVPVLMYKSKASAFIDFCTEREEMEIDKVKYPIRTVKLEGESNFTGIFGLTGDFEGWFSDDYACIPIYAKMHVLIGSVRLELIKWKKKGWKPPRYVER